MVYFSTTSPVAQLILLNCPAMVFVVGGKLMAPVLARNEIEEIRMVRFQRRPNGVQTRTGNRTGGKSKILVGIVRRVNGQILFTDIAVEIDHGVDNGRVRLQAHFFNQTIVKNG